MMELEDETDIVVAEGSEFSVIKVWNELLIDLKNPFVRYIQRSQDMQQGTFSCSGFSNNSDDLSPIYVQIDSLKDM